MKLSKSTLLGSFFLASTVLAIRSSQLKTRLAPRHNRRQLELTGRDDSDSNVEYNDLWSGAICNMNNGDLTFVVGTFTVPTSVTGYGVGSAWVGIDGQYCSPGLFQAGVDVYMSGGDPPTPSYHAWYQWYPADSIYDIMPVNPGDVIKVAINATSTTTGNVVMENLTTKDVVRKSLSYPQYPLCLASAEWILEDYNGDSGPLIDFGSVTFTNAIARGPSGETCTPSGATIAEIQQNGTVFTSTTTEESSVTIKYI